MPLPRSKVHSGVEWKGPADHGGHSRSGSCLLGFKRCIGSQISNGFRVSDVRRIR